LTRVFYSPAYVGAGHEFDTTRKSSWIAESLTRSPLHGIRLVEPTPLTPDQILSVHDAGYVNAIRTGEPRPLAESQGFAWDPNVWTMVASSNGGAVAAALAALEDGVAGSLSSGLHHAKANRGEGFCTFNGLVIAARSALAAGAKSVLILDLDAHCGGGTASLIADEPRVSQIDVSVNEFDRYIPTRRTRLEIVHRAEDYLPTIGRLLDEVLKASAFDLCIYNAGMDPFEKSNIGSLEGITRDILASRERMVFDRCRTTKTPIAFVLAGGYIGDDFDKTALVELHRLTLEEAARAMSAW
jgi:acetoin utilization deacetylase AcuC-like enzyme